jgi:hypothetical protein
MLAPTRVPSLFEGGNCGESGEVVFVLVEEVEEGVADHDARCGGVRQTYEMGIYDKKFLWRGLFIFFAELQVRPFLVASEIGGGLQTRPP